MSRHLLLTSLLCLAACGEPLAPEFDGFSDSGAPEPKETEDAGVTDAGIVDAGVPDAGTQCADTWASFGSSFFAARCNSCHAFTHSSVRGDRTRISQQISSGRMPRGSSLTTAQRTRILEYLTCGAP